MDSTSISNANSSYFTQALSKNATAQAAATTGITGATGEKAATTTTTSAAGDVVTISAEGQEKAATLKSGSMAMSMSGGAGTSTTASTEDIDDKKNEISRAEAAIENLKTEAKKDESKQAKLNQKQSELDTLEKELTQLENA